MTDQEFRRLLKGYKAQTLTPGELIQFLDAASAPHFEAIIAEDFSQSVSMTRSLAVTDREKQDETWNNIKPQHQIPGRTTADIRKSYRRGWMAAAAVLLLLSTAAYFWLNEEAPEVTKTVAVTPAPTDIEAGREGAILTLADGTKVVLDTLGNGVVTSQYGARVMLRNGQLVYDAFGKPAEVAHHKMTTPKGRQFSLVLPDGTKAWLNAASSITYPTFFADANRRVNITGEVYFEVAKDDKKPFHVVISDDAEVQVLGTQFNINSYENETSIATTLLEGSIRLIHGDERATLRPGQQAQVSSGSAAEIRIVNDVNVGKVMAGKNGVFDFQDATLQEVMRQLERWYDIEVVYEKDTPKIEFIGKMGRDLSLSNVLRGLEMSKVKFRLEGERKLVVMP